MPFKIIRNDITKVAADMIVNTANPEVLIGPGVDYAIYSAAGEAQLLKAREDIGVLCPGEVAVTPAFNLSAKYIAHSSGPIWKDGKEGEQQILKQCYDKCLQLALKYKCKSIAFPLMATGAYGFPNELGMQIAIEAFKEFLLLNEMEITLVVFDDYSYRISGKLFEDVQDFINDRCCVEEKLSVEQHGDFCAVCDDVCDDVEKEYFRAPESAMSKSRLSLPMQSVCANEKAEMPTAKAAMSLEERLKEMYTDSFEKHLQQIINKKGLKNSEVYTAANISKQYFSKLMKGKVKPSKAKVLSLAVGLQLNIDEAIDFLRIAGYALSPVSQTDVIVEYFIRNEDYSVMKIDFVLFDCGLPLLTE